MYNTCHGLGKYTRPKVGQVETGGTRCLFMMFLPNGQAYNLIIDAMC